MTIQPIPTVDLRDLGDGTSANAKEASEKLFHAFQSNGTAYILSDLVTEDKVQKMLDWDRKSFALSPQVLESVRHGKSMDVHRGYVPTGFEHVNPGDPDANETFEVGPDESKYVEAIRQPNKWPEENSLPGFRSECVEFMNDVNAISQLVFEALTIAIPEIPKGFLANNHTEGWHFRMLHYPPSTLGQARLAAHSDFGSFTLVFQDSVGGLEIQDPTRENTFVSAPAMRGGVIVHIGDIMARWSNDLLHSTVHRVMPPVSETETMPDRYSMVFYTKPDMESVIDALPGTSGEHRPKKYPAMTVAEFFAAKFAEFYPDGGRE